MDGWVGMGAVQAWSVRGNIQSKGWRPVWATDSRPHPFGVELSAFSAFRHFSSARVMPNLLHHNASFKRLYGL